jgi:hypothetical protein
MMAIFNKRPDPQQEAVDRAAEAVKKASSEAKKAIARLVTAWENEDIEPPKRINGGSQ